MHIIGPYSQNFNSDLGRDLSICIFTNTTPIPILILVPLICESSICEKHKSVFQQDHSVLILIKPFQPILLCLLSESSLTTNPYILVSLSRFFILYLIYRPLPFKKHFPMSEFSFNLYISIFPVLNSIPDYSQIHPRACWTSLPGCCNETSRQWYPQPHILQIKD